MFLRDKLTWMTVMVLALSAEGSAMAQSAPARTGNASDPALARIEQGSASVGPELEAARASLSGATKKSDSGFDLKSLANRQAPAGSAVASALIMPNGAGAPIQSNAGGGDSLQMLHGDAVDPTSTAAGPASRVVPVGGPQAGGAMGAPPAHAESVIRGQINPAARSCYENDPDSKAHPGRLTVLIKLAPAGDVDSVIVTSNTGLSPSVASCITTAAHAARFAAPGASGAMVRAAFTFLGQEDPAPPAVTPAKGARAAKAGSPPRDTLAAADAPPADGPTPHR
ncbi:MAG TPA: hypothetical protein VK762_20755 [Polyangiaceae bacterium]|jgi:hypothetical protein|nr:hypothetical protein [Polyangiaceae bacterium]